MKKTFMLAAAALMCACGKESEPNIPPMPVPPAPVAPYILYFDATSQTLALGKWGAEVTASNILYVKSGSLVAVTGGDEEFAPQSVAFNPTAVESFDDFLDIPAYQNADFDAGLRNTSAPTYHNDANFALGKGDICKLVGLTAAQARQRIAAGTLDDHDSGFRLPTNAENATFVGGPTSDEGLYEQSTELGTGLSPRANYYVATPVALAYFPIVQGETPNTAGVALPALGFRDSSGKMMSQGDGYYRSSDITMAFTCDNLYFNSTFLMTAASAGHGFGFGVRCVKTK
jgi:hypothetical protein